MDFILPLNQLALGLAGTLIQEELLHWLMFPVPVVLLLAKLVQKVHHLFNCHHIPIDEVPKFVPTK